MSDNGQRRQASTPEFLAGGGELGALMRAHDWAATALGPAADWPQSLKTAVRIMLTSRQPIWIGWGRELIYLYNDPYKSIMGGKHPWALGRPTSEVWQEIRADIDPMLSTAMGGIEGTYVEEQLLIMERNGYPEETYYTFSYSPIPDDDGTPGGIICANTDDTQRVVGERQLALLRDLAAGTVDARSCHDAAARSAVALGNDPQDLPFAILYVEESRNGPLLRAGLCGIAPEHPAAPAQLARETPACWPLYAALDRHEPQIVAAADLPFSLPCGAWSRPPAQVAVLPIAPSGDTGRAGALVVGLNPYRLLDDGYRGFLGLVAGQIAAAMAQAEAWEEERRRAEALAEIDRAKTQFFSNVSHEFRTPLTLMLGPLEDLLAAGALNGDDRTQIEMVHRNGLRLLRLVNALLDFSRIEAGRMQARFEPTDLAALTAELTSTFRAATERAGLALTVDCPPLAEPVYVDRDLWEKVVLNLLSNAFKFTFEGGIAVQLRCTEGAVELSVRDSGTGIAAEALPHLFERFHRIEGARGRSYEGSGIGLALVQELVRLHGGSIRVDSAPGAGSTFSVRLPLGTSHLPADQVHETAPAASPGARAQVFVDEALRWLPGDGGNADRDALAGLASGSDGGDILLADDNADMRDYVERLLGARHRVRSAPDGAAALAELRRARPDLLLTDIMMPGMDGFALLREIRADAVLRDLPVIMLSARAGAEASIEGLQAGADGYLVKPFSARELIARVDSALAMARLRRQMHEALRQSEARFRYLADQAPVMIWTTDAEGQCSYVNRAWCQFTGQTPEQALGFAWLDAVEPDDRQRARVRFVEAHARREPFTSDYRLRRADGELRDAVNSAAPWFGPEGEFLGYIGSVIDITELRRAEQTQRELNDILQARVAAAIAERQRAEAQLIHAQKMEAVGKLTGGVAHDFSNLLQVIGGNLQLLQDHVAGQALAEQRLATALEAVVRGAKLSAQLLAFGRRQPLDPKVVNLGRLVRGLDEIIRRTLGEEIDVETIIAAGLWNTLVDPSQVENALLNLAINARDAMQGHGRLTIEAGNAFLDDHYAGAAGIEPGQYVMLAVTDTGCGMSAEVIERAFEPFFTTKPEGQGTGLGLSMVYGFVRQSGGHVRINSELAHGTTVRIYLPRARAEEAPPPGTWAVPATGGSETILVVEDDDAVRATVVELLTELGYRVLKARDAESAFAIVDSGLEIDLLFTDVVMPGPMRSPELARRTRERSPRTAVLFTSGYTDGAIVHGGRLDAGVELLSKPYSREVLARKIRQVLRQHAAAQPIGSPPAAEEPTEV